MNTDDVLEHMWIRFERGHVNDNQNSSPYFVGKARGLSYYYSLSQKIDDNGIFSVIGPI